MRSNNSPGHIFNVAIKNIQCFVFCLTYMYVLQKVFETTLIRKLDQIFLPVNKQANGWCHRK